MPKPSIESLILSADPATLFGEIRGVTPEQRLSELDMKYRGFTLVLPVDADEAKAKLDQLYDAAKLVLGITPATVKNPLPETPLNVITAFPGRFELSEPLWQDALCDMYAGVRRLNGESLPCTARLAAEEECNGFIQREAHVLAKLGANAPTADPFHSHFRRYLPAMLGAFSTARGDAKESLCGILLEDLAEFRTLEEVREAYPEGVEFQTAVWMFNRLLEGLGYAHRQGIIHGGLIPPNVLIRAEDHAAKLIGWNAAVVDPQRTGDYVRLMNNDFIGFYPPEILEKELPTPAADIFMAAKCLVYVLGGETDTDKMPDSVPDYLQNFLKSCLILNPYQRPQDAWQVRDEFYRFMQDNYGPPRFHPFAMPPRKQPENAD